MNIEELLSQVEKVKISIIMQVSLANYPGSRTDAVNKYRRAIKSFQAQMYENTELIIVSDGCARAHQIYAREFKQDPSIKFMLLDKNGAKDMYEDTENGKYYRGFPRRAGVGIATGSLITYMDSDDYLMPEFAMTLMLMYNAAPDKDWYINTSWYDNDIHSWDDNETMENTDHSAAIEIDGLASRWTPTQVKEGYAVLSPWLFMHKATCTTKWRDTIGSSEDSDFNRRLRESYPNGYSYAKPIYVRCHYRDIWDF